MKFLKQKNIYLFLALLTCCFISLSFADIQPSANDPTIGNLALNVPKPPLIIPPPPSLDAKSYLLIDAASGQILAAKNPDMRVAPASLTKMMSLYLISQALTSGQIHLTDQVHISEKAWKTGGSRMFIRVGSFVPVSDLIQGVIVDSGNDATTALAEYVAGSTDSFVALMNQQAKILGMDNSHFVDPTGLPDPNHYTTATDMGTLAHAIITNFPLYYGWYKQKSFTYGNITQSNRNKLLFRDPSVDGLKTGHTDDAGFCLVASAQRDGMRLISVVMGAPNNNARDDYNQRLLNYGFRFYKTYQVYQASAVITQPRVWLGEKSEVPLGLSKDLAVTLTQGKNPHLIAKITLNGVLKAPIVKDQTYGTITLLEDDKPLLTRPLIALETIPQGGFWSRLFDHAALAIHQITSNQPSKSQS